MRECKFKSFQIWLSNEKIVTTPKQVSDYASRLRKIDKAFAPFGIDIDSEWKKDRCYRLLRVMAREGQNPEAAEFAGVDLPLKCDASPIVDRKDRKAGMYCNALKKYVLYRGLSEGLSTEEIAEIWGMKSIVRNYLEKHSTNRVH